MRMEPARGGTRTLKRLHKEITFINQIEKLRWKVKGKYTKEYLTEYTGEYTRKVLFKEN